MEAERGLVLKNYSMEAKKGETYEGASGASAERATEWKGVHSGGPLLRRPPPFSPS